MFNFLKPSPDATKLVPKEKVAGEYRKRQAGRTAFQSVKLG